MTKNILAQMMQHMKKFIEMNLSIDNHNHE